MFNIDWGRIGVRLLVVNIFDLLRHGQVTIRQLYVVDEAYCKFQGYSKVKMPITTSLKTGRYSEMTHLETIYVGTQEADNLAQPHNQICPREKTPKYGAK